MGNEKKKILVLVCLLGSLTGSSQRNFDSLYTVYDPVTTEMSSEEKRILHHEFFEDASLESDTLKVLLGHFYLASDFGRAADYEQSLQHLIMVTEIAKELRDTLVLGRAQHRIATTYAITENNLMAIQLFEEALKLNRIAEDSQFIAISLEQLGALHGYEENFELSKEYYEQAIPMVARHCPPRSMSTTLSNFGNTLIQQDNYEEAIDVYKQAVKIGEELNDLYRIIPAKQNLALAYSNVDSSQKALELYKYCTQINRQESWLDFLIFSYKGLANVYGDLNMTDSSLYYFKEFYYLKDSLFGVKTQTSLNKLMSEKAEIEQDMLILKKDNELLALHRKNHQLVIIGTIIFLLAIGFTYLFWYKRRKSEQQLLERNEALLELSKILQSKNATIRNLMDQNAKQRKESLDTSISDVQFNVLDSRILTEDDWNTFKIRYEKVYPGFILKLRNRFPAITEAEERLFLFIKLQLTNKESADILGIKKETIKKTRTRLRKKLGISNGTDLDEFVRSF